MKPTLNELNLLQKRSDRENKSKAYYPQQTELGAELLNDWCRLLSCGVYSLIISQKLNPSIVVTVVHFLRSSRFLVLFTLWVSCYGEWRNEALLLWCSHNRGNESWWYASFSIWVLIQRIPPHSGPKHADVLGSTPSRTDAPHESPFTVSQNQHHTFPNICSDFTVDNSSIIHHKVKVKFGGEETHLIKSASYCLNIDLCCSFQVYNSIVT